MLAFHPAALRAASGDAHGEYRRDSPDGHVVSGHNQVSAEAAASAVLQQLRISARAKVQPAQNTRARRTAGGFDDILSTSHRVSTLDEQVLLGHVNVGPAQFAQLTAPVTMTSQ